MEFSKPVWVLGSIDQGIQKVLKWILRVLVGDPKRIKTLTEIERKREFKRGRF